MLDIRIRALLWHQVWNRGSSEFRSATCRELFNHWRTAGKTMKATAYQYNGSSLRRYKVNRFRG